eukprot:gene27314-4619_t
MMRGRSALSLACYDEDEVRSDTVTCLHDEVRLACHLPAIDEVRLLRKLDHPNIMRYIGIGYSDESSEKKKRESMFLACEVMQGGTLNKLVMHQMLMPHKSLYTLVTAMKWCINMADALAYLHTSQPTVIHRDLKLENILLKGGVTHSTQEACLADFGLATYVQNKIVHPSKPRTSNLACPSQLSPADYDMGAEAMMERMDPCSSAGTLQRRAHGMLDALERSVRDGASYLNHSIKGGSHFNHTTRGGNHFNPSIKGGDHLSPSTKGGDHFNHSTKGGNHFNPSMKGGDHFNPSTKGGGHFNHTSKGGNHFNHTSKEGDHYNHSTKGGNHFNPSMKGGEHFNSSMKRGSNPSLKGGSHFSPSIKGGNAFFSASVHGGRAYFKAENLPVPKALLSGKTGSLMYMSPEMYRNENKYTEKVDVFSFGVCMYELLHKYCMAYAIIGQESAGEEIERYAQNVSEGYRPPIHKQLPGDLKLLIADCWAQDPKERPAMIQVAERLKAIRDEGLLEANLPPPLLAVGTHFNVL